MHRLVISTVLLLATILIADRATAADVRERTITTRPNHELIGSGVFTLGVPYTVSVIVAATSGLDADRYLFIPVVGPWIDLAVRPGCPITRLDCNQFNSNETAAKAGLIVDGIFQGMGALAIAGGFLWRREVHVRETTTTVRITPYGTGLMLSGTF